jgi:hypothetical protein
MESALAVLHDLVEIVLQKASEFIGFRADLIAECSRFEQLIKFVGQFR